MKNKRFTFIVPLVLLSSFTIADQTPTHKDKQDKAVLIDLSKMLLAGDVEALKNTAIDGVVSEGVGVSKSYLEKYFPTVEITYSGLEGSKPTGGLLVVAPLSDEADIFNTYFTQISAFHSDSRTTLNLGLGYRKLSDNKLLLTGINAFYDHEFPYDHGRTSLGVEARTSMWELSANKYWATTDWETGRKGKQERALDGFDVEAGVAIPYMNWATLYVSHFEWDAYDGNVDPEGQKVSFRALFPGELTGLEVEAGRTLYTANGYDDENFVKVSYNLTQLFNKKAKTTKWVSDVAYKLESMEDRRFEKVRRNNTIVKQVKFTAKAKGV